MRFRIYSEKSAISFVMSVRPSAHSISAASAGQISMKFGIEDVYEDRFWEVLKLCKNMIALGKAKFHNITVHDGPEGSMAITLLFLQPRR
jgi:hypothetical protein